jgi:hypothetical protein
VLQDLRPGGVASIAGRGVQGAAGQAAWPGGPWECRVWVRSGLVAVTVPSEGWHAEGD